MSSLLRRGVVWAAIFVEVAALRLLQLAGKLYAFTGHRREYMRLVRWFQYGLQQQEAERWMEQRARMLEKAPLN